MLGYLPEVELVKHTFCSQDMDSIFLETVHMDGSCYSKLATKSSSFLLMIM